MKLVKPKGFVLIQNQNLELKNNNPEWLEVMCMVCSNA
jgi:hypothetical protein